MSKTKKFIDQKELWFLDGESQSELISSIHADHVGLYQVKAAMTGGAPVDKPSQPTQIIGQANILLESATSGEAKEGHTVKEHGFTITPVKLEQFTLDDVKRFFLDRHGTEEVVTSPPKSPKPPSMASASWFIGIVPFPKLRGIMRKLVADQAAEVRDLTKQGRIKSARWQVMATWGLLFFSAMAFVITQCAGVVRKMSPFR
jgi:hypothetical protein